MSRYHRHRFYNFNENDTQMYSDNKEIGTVDNKKYFASATGVSPAPETLPAPNFVPRSQKATS